MRGVARAVVAGRVDEAARALVAPDVTVLALTDRAFTDDEAFARAALLVEEAAVEVGRAALAGGPGTQRYGEA